MRTRTDLNECRGDIEHYVMCLCGEESQRFSQRDYGAEEAIVHAKRSAVALGFVQLAGVSGPTCTKCTAEILADAAEGDAGGEP